MNTPVVPVTVEQFVVGFVVVAQHVPRAVIALVPAEVTLAPRIAVAKLIEVAVGDVTVGVFPETAPVVNVPSGVYPVPVAFVA